jgi:hypothetical protein
LFAGRVNAFPWWSMTFTVWSSGPVDSINRGPLGRKRIVISGMGYLRVAVRLRKQCDEVAAGAQVTLTRNVGEVKRPPPCLHFVLGASDD